MEVPLSIHLPSLIRVTVELSERRNGASLFFKLPPEGVRAACDVTSHPRPRCRRARTGDNSRYQRPRLNILPVQILGRKKSNSCLA